MYIVDDQMDIDFLQHYGVGHLDGGNSGRYPWGSGSEPYQRATSFTARVSDLKKQGLSEDEIVKSLKLSSTSELRDLYRYDNNLIRLSNIRRAKDLAEKGMGASAIGKEMGVNESTIRGWLNPHTEERLMVAVDTADFLRNQVKEKGMIDVGPGVEYGLNISRDRLDEALYILKQEGYEVFSGRVPQVTNPNPKRQTTQTVLCPPGTEHSEIYDFSRVHRIDDEFRSDDKGHTFVSRVMRYPESLDSKRLQIVYGDQGGKEKDGLIEIRPGVADLSLGNSHYQQVRILVDGTHYLKGMAVYAYDLPDGVDIRFNTNKSSSKPVMGYDEDGTPNSNGVLKPISKKDPNNPFGSLISHQTEYTGADGKQHLSLINSRAIEGEWSDWEDRVPAQFLAKQSLQLIRRQINLSLNDKQKEFEEIESLTNPTIKRQLLNTFADNCDSAAVNLYAAALPNQKWHVILPVPSLEDDEVYAPQYKNGTKVALVRYPHEGTFQIPILTVNNRRRKAAEVVGNNSIDAIGINSNVAQRLSGADFDGDTVMVIPTGGNSSIDIISTPRLRGLVGFDPELEYPGTATSKRMNERYKQKQMGVISNLITDMTLQGASTSELARATRHSMVVIDSVKHGYDYQASYIDNRIEELKRKYQRHTDDDRYGGASTLISRAGAIQRVDERRGSPHVNLEGSPYYDSSRPLGALIYTNSGRTNRDGRPRQQESTRMAETDDARTLISSANTRQEQIYASYANTLKGMANLARVEAANTERLRYSPSAATIYAPQVQHLRSELNLARRNAPRERAAQRLASSRFNAISQEYPDMTREDARKLKAQLLTAARDETGSSRHRITVTEDDWEAIQNGAISDSMLQDILRYTDLGIIRSYAMPHNRSTLTANQEARIRSLYFSHLTIEEIASAMGLSPSTVREVIKQWKN